MDHVLRVDADRCFGSGDGPQRMAVDHGQRYFVGPDDNPDKYRLTQQAGGGGEAQLWQADLTVAGGVEPVAVKILRPDRNPDFSRLSERWSEQAELLRFVRHPGVVGVREHFEGAPFHLAGSHAETNGRSLYLVMNWVDGVSLRAWALMNRDASDHLPRVLRYLDQAAYALDWLHSGAATPSARPLVHGDLSPGNLMITPTGQTVLVDFGLVRVVSHQTRDAAGTPGFAAPEVWSDGQYSPASDRYSFGAIAYFALTGSAPPLYPPAVMTGLAAHPLVASAAPATIERLSLIFSEEPSDRPPASEWLRLLRGAATTATVGEGPAPAAHAGGGAAGGVPPPRAGRRTVPAALAAIAILVLGVVVGAGLRGGDAATPASSGGELRGQAGTTGPSVATSAADAPDSARSVIETTVRRETGRDPLVLTAGYGVDLDSKNPDWGVSDAILRVETDISVSNYSDGLHIDRRSNEVDIGSVSGGPDYATCERLTAYHDSILLKDDDRYCVRTTGGRYAHLTVLRAEYPVTLQVTVWDPPRGS